MADEKGISQKIEDFVVSGYGAIGGEQAAQDARAAWDAQRAGHLGESLRLSLKTDGDVISHVVGHDNKPLETPTSQKTVPTKANLSR